MPVSKRRKKKGKPVGKGSRIQVDPEKPSSISLQDLINVVAYQEFKAGNYDPPEAPELPEVKAAEIYAKAHTREDTEIAPGIILRADAVINIPDSVPVNIENERGEKIGVGTASPIEGDPDHVSISITDPAILQIMQGPVSDFSIGTEENADER